MQLVGLTGEAEHPGHNFINSLPQICTQVPQNIAWNSTSYVMFETHLWSAAVTT
jgi:hypothetical protein